MTDLTPHETTLTAVLETPFARDDIKTRKGPGGRSLAYVEGVDVVRRLLAATDPNTLIDHGCGYDWTVLRCDRIERGTSAIWLVHGRLNIVPLGSRDGIGTANDETEDSPKAAAKDALKVAASLFGVALDLYDKEFLSGGSGAESPHAAQRNGTQAPQAAGPAAGAWEGEGSCPSCHAPTGKRHGTTCALGAPSGR